ncbi:MAG: DUF3168 domain-containing protein [Desulfobulbaceae bacterium]|nr:DUF3168 domain-containing protein [Desulfobulbaceae bacterium]
MSIETTIDSLAKGLVARLKGFAGLTALVGARIYLGTVPQGQPRPAVTLQLVSVVPTGDMRSHECERSRWQVSAWGDTYTQARTTATQVVAALSGFSGSLGGVATVQQIFFDDQLEIAERPDDSDGAGFHHIPTDFMVWS